MPRPCRRVDPQAGTVNDSYTTEEFGRITELLAGGSEAGTALRWRHLLQVSLTQLFVTVMHFGVGRGDDARGMRISWIGKPREVDVLSTKEVVKAYMLPITLYTGKTQVDRLGMLGCYWRSPACGLLVRTEVKGIRSPLYAVARPFSSR
jgi:hypothetical protein